MRRFTTGTSAPHPESPNTPAGDEPIHAPDEYFRLESLLLGQRGHARLLERLAELPGEALRQA